jgi:hypothetical protein
VVSAVVIAMTYRELGAEQSVLKPKEAN